MATHSSILAWRIPWTEEPVSLQSIESQRVGHDWTDVACIIILKYWIIGLIKWVNTCKKLKQSLIIVNIQWLSASADPGWHDCFPRVKTFPHINISNKVKQPKEFLIFINKWRIAGGWGREGRKIMFISLILLYFGLSTRRKKRDIFQDLPETSLHITSYAITF